VTDWLIAEEKDHQVVDTRIMQRCCAIKLGQILIYEERKK
jgi:hypothetical protein